MPNFVQLEMKLRNVLWDFTRFGNENDTLFYTCDLTHPNIILRWIARSNPKKPITFQIFFFRNYFWNTYVGFFLNKSAYSKIFIESTVHATILVVPLPACTRTWSRKIKIVASVHWNTLFVNLNWFLQRIYWHDNPHSIFMYDLGSLSNTR